MRAALRKACEIQGAPALHGRLAALDPESAQRIHPNDRVRIVRALEILTLTGEPAARLMERHGFRENRFNALKICLQMERPRLYDRINLRCHRMMADGLLDETEGLLRQGYSPELKSMKALGYRHMVAQIKGLWTPEEALRELQKDTRRYAKRQLTWFRADPEIIWVEPEKWTEMIPKIKAFLMPAGAKEVFR